jgi:DNA/RNA-binding domain of Phe-tRNA-synthetase-like protein
MDESYAVTCEPEVCAKALVVHIWAEDIAPPTTAAPLQMLDDLLARLGRGETLVPDETRSQVRDMLRHGCYKPTGRGKPASEFLLQAALRGEFPRLSEPVDANNAISLASGYPGSVFDRDLSGSSLHVRYGLPGETYVFNPSGQSMDLEDLIVVCRAANEGWEPCGNPVKDAMTTKIRPTTRNVISILYVPRILGEGEALTWAGRFAELLLATCHAKRSGCSLAVERALPS